MHARHPLLRSTWIAAFAALPLAIAASSATAAPEPPATENRERPFCTRARCLGSPAAGWDHAAAFAAAAVATGCVARRRRGPSQPASG